MGTTLKIQIGDRDFMHPAMHMRAGEKYEIDAESFGLKGKLKPGSTIGANQGLPSDTIIISVDGETAGAATPADDGGGKPVYPNSAYKTGDEALYSVDDQPIVWMRPRSDGDVNLWIYDLTTEDSRCLKQNISKADAQAMADSFVNEDGTAAAVAARNALGLGADDSADTDPAGGVKNDDTGGDS